MQTKEHSMNQRIFTFWVGEQIYGMPLLLVGEFCPSMQLTPVEVGDQRVPAVAHVRGITAVVLDMNQVLGSSVKSKVSASKDRIYILSQEQLCEEALKRNLTSFQESVVLEVDRLENILEVDLQELHPTPAHLDEDFYQGVFETPNGDVILLEFTKLIECIISDLKKAHS